jgi:16S rRNA (cytosine1402-N4)-methyltransferase
MKTPSHKPVLLKESLYFLSPKEGKSFIDATLGAAGHTNQLAKSSKVLSIEADPKMIEIVSKQKNAKLKVKRGNFKDIDTIAKKAGFQKVDGILFDLGISSIHLDKDERGFSFKNRSNPLDMRLDPASQSVTASDLLNTLRKDQLARLFSQVETHSKAASLAKKVVEKRKFTLFKTISDFLEITGEKTISHKIHPATKPLMALRMATNSEAQNLKEALPKAFSLLKKGGRLVVISFHSGEDTLVKGFFKETQSQALGKILTKKPITPSKEEISKNKRSRSAKMRVLEKI